MQQQYNKEEESFNNYSPHLFLSSTSPFSLGTTPWAPTVSDTITTRGALQVRKSCEIPYFHHTCLCERYFLHAVDSFQILWTEWNSSQNLTSPLKSSQVCCRGIVTSSRWSNLGKLPWIKIDIHVSEVQQDVNVFLNTHCKQVLNIIVKNYIMFSLHTMFQKSYI